MGVALRTALPRREVVDGPDVNTEHLGSTDRADSPEEILRRRFAAGEIDEDEYFRLRADLRDELAICRHEALTSPNGDE